MIARTAYLEALVTAVEPGRDVVVAGLGANARYLPHMSVPVPCFALCDAMGSAIPLALGVALARSDRRVIALEGDGSLLMNLGTLATVGAARAANLVALLFRNRHYESSGGQDLPPVDVGDAAAFPAALARARAAGGPALVLATAFDPAEPIPPYSERPTRFDWASCARSPRAADVDGRSRLAGARRLAYAPP